MEQKLGTKVGVISDTHGLLRPEAVTALAGSELILHAGDIGKPEIITELNRIAPVIAVRGNNDKGEWAKIIPEHKTIQVEEISIHLIHIVKEIALDLEQPSIQVIVSGHSHKPVIKEDQGILFLNPGSAGPKRFKLPISVACLHIHKTKIQAQIINL